MLVSWLVISLEFILDAMRPVTVVSHLSLGVRQTDATVMAATSAAAAAARPVTRPGHAALRRSGSLMDFSGELVLFLLTA